MISGHGGSGANDARGYLRPKQRCGPQALPCRLPEGTSARPDMVRSDLVRPEQQASAQDQEQSRRAPDIESGTRRRPAAFMGNDRPVSRCRLAWGARLRGGLWGAPSDCRSKGHPAVRDAHSVTSADHRTTVVNHPQQAVDLALPHRAVAVAGGGDQVADELDLRPQSDVSELLDSLAGGVHVQNTRTVNSDRAETLPNAYRGLAELIPGASDCICQGATTPLSLPDLIEQPAICAMRTESSDRGRWHWGTQGPGAAAVVARRRRWRTRVTGGAPVSPVAHRVTGGAPCRNPGRATPARGGEETPATAGDHRSWVALVICPGIADGGRCATKR